MASNKIAVTDLEFDAIKANLKEHLSAQTQFQDYDFEEVREHIIELFFGPQMTIFFR